MIYNKLVRDRIPELIRNRGETPNIRTLDDAEYRKYLEQKLNEEVAEYHKDKNLEELADILEVVYALSADMGYSEDDLMAAYRCKHESRGGFANRVFLISKDG